MRRAIKVCPLSRPGEGNRGSQARVPWAPQWSQRAWLKCGLWPTVRLAAQIDSQHEAKTIGDISEFWKNFSSALSLEGCVSRWIIITRPALQLISYPLFFSQLLISYQPVIYYSPFISDFMINYPRVVLYYLYVFTCYQYLIFIF